MARGYFCGGGFSGVDCDDATAAEEDILEGRTAGISGKDDLVQGRMPERGDWNGSVGMNGSVTIPDGHHSGGGKVTGPAVTQRGAWEGNVGLNSSVTVPEGYHNGKGKVNGPKVTISSVVSFKAAPYSTDQVLLTWTNPSKGPYSGFIVCAKAGSYPANINDSRKYTGVGTNHNLGAANSVIISGLTPGTTYYFRIWTYCTVSTGNMYSGYLQASAKTTAHGRVAFTQSGSWTVPAGVRSIDIHCTGAGGGGGWRTKKTGVGSGGGGGGYTSYRKGIPVSPGQVVNYVVGQGSGVDGGESNATINGITINAAGGFMGETDSNLGAAGGSGGGNGRDATDSDGNYGYGGNGGTNGSDGWRGYYGNSSNNSQTGGKGQGVTTKEFGESGGTLYSGGGGGGFYKNSNNEWTKAGLGGAGGGGAGGVWSVREPGDGATGTGGGGGGSQSYSHNADVKQFGKGGSGNVIIRW